MKKTKIGIILLTLLCLLSACTKNDVTKTDPANDDLTISGNPFENSSNEDAGQTVVMGSIGHGIPNMQNEDDTIKKLEYTGGDFEVDYWISATGISANCGFFVYLDGVPQKYKIKETDDYQYMHKLQLEEGVDNNFKINFVPTVGKKDDILELCIVSVNNPNYIPDMKESTSYGHFHKMIESIYPISFLEDSQSSSELEQQNVNLINNIKTDVKEIAIADIEKYEEHGQTVSLEKDVFTELYLDDIDMNLDESFDMTGKDVIKVTFKIFGHPGIKYKNIMYLNHAPIEYETLNYIETTLVNGAISIFEAEIDVSSLDELSSFYIVSVPSNVKDFPDDAITLIKTNSIVLYKNTTTSPTVATSKNSELKNDANDISLLSDASIKSAIFDDKSITKSLKSMKDIKNIVYASHNKILILSDKLYLYDISKNDFIANTENRWMENIEFKSHDGGYSLVGKNESNEIECVFFDEKLKEISTLNVNRDFKIDVVFTKEVTISHDGTKLAVNDMQAGLYICDIEKKDKKLLIDTESDGYKSSKGIVMFDKIAFTDNDNKITFISSSFQLPLTAGQKSYESFGIVNTNGTGLTVFEGKDISILTAYHEYSLLSEDIANNGPKGEAWILDSKTAEVNKLALNQKAESEHIWGSDQGKYLATSVRQNNKGWKIRIYDVNTGETVYDQLFACTNTDQYREPYIKIFDDAKGFILFFRPLGDHSSFEIFASSF